MSHNYLDTSTTNLNSFDVPANSIGNEDCSLALEFIIPFLLEQIQSTRFIDSECSDSRDCLLGQAELSIRRSLQKCRDPIEFHWLQNQLQKIEIERVNISQRQELTNHFISQGEDID